MNRSMINNHLLYLKTYNNWSEELIKNQKKLFKLESKPSKNYSLLLSKKMWKILRHF